MNYHNSKMKRILKLTLFLGVIFLSNLSVFGQVKNRSGEDSTIFISHTVFLPKYDYESGNENWSVALGDIDKDGDIDLVSCSKDGMINFHANDGKGRFGPKRSFPSGKDCRNITIADLNGDGWLDVATVTKGDGRLNWHFNDKSPNGGFEARKSVETGPFPHDVTAADVNQDGNIDLITVINAMNTLNIHYGDGAGNFTGATKIPTGLKPRAVEVGDVNGDGIPDIVTGSDDRNFNLHIGKGGGKFNPKKGYLSGGANWGLKLADFNKDGKLDIACSSYNDNLMCVHLNQGEANGVVKFEKQCLQSGDYNFDLCVGDFDMDGDIDIISASTRDEVINVHINLGDGKFSEKHKITSGNWNSAIAGADLDGDTDMDIVTSSIKDGRVNIHRNITLGEKEFVTSTCIQGTVRDKDTDQPLVAIVALVGEDGMSIASGKTGPDGKYRFCELPFGTGFTLKAKSRGYPKFEEPVDLPEELGKEGLNKDIYLEKIKETFVFGQIVDQETRVPLAQADITIKDKNGNTVKILKADANGKYKELLKFDTNYEITVTYEGYNEKSGLVSLYPNNYPMGVEKNFELLKKKPKTSACVKGIVYEEGSNKTITVAKADVKILDKQGNTVKSVKSDDKGYYEACDIPFGKYDMTAVAKGYFFKLDSVEVKPEDVETGVEKDLELVKIEIGKKIILRNIYYDVAKATLRPESTAELDRLVTIMHQNPTLVIEVGGHTDSDGSDSYNERLSQARAQSVVDYLLDAGFGEERMVAKGYGEKEPVAPNDTKENKQLNRRTEIKVLDF